MVETSRLESGRTLTGTGGSNPSLSASNSWQVSQYQLITNNKTTYGQLPMMDKVDKLGVICCLGVNCLTK